jgi:xanthine dehydrogenase YagS FAD-binding subunit
MHSFQYITVSTLKEAIAQLSDNTAMLKAGGVDVLDMLKEGYMQPDKLVNILNVPGLDGVRLDPATGLHIGALAKLNAVAESAVVKKTFPALHQSADQVASYQIRNMATVGGNLCQRPRCWYFRSEQHNCLKKGGDRCYSVEGENQYHAIFGEGPCHIVHPSGIAPALIAYNAKVKITGPKGSRVIPIEELFVMPGRELFKETVLESNEILEEVIVPAPAAGAKAFYTKHREREGFDWPLAEVAAVLIMQGPVVQSARVVLGHAAPIPWRVKKAEAVLTGKKLTTALAMEAGKAAMSGAKPMRDNAYKVQLFPVVVQRTLLAAAGMAQA